MNVLKWIFAQTHTTLHNLKDMNEEITRNFLLTLSIGVLVGLILSKIYTYYFIAAILGKGPLNGRMDRLFFSSLVDTSHGKVRTLRISTPCPIDTKPPLVILIHGYAGSLDMYADPTRANYCKILSDNGFDVITFDLYGHGGSDSPDTLFSAELFASQLAELLFALNVREPFSLIAHSMGSSVAVTFAHRYPSLVNKLVLISPSVVDKPMEFRLRIALQIPFFREVLSYFIIPTFGEGANKNNPGLLRACYRLLETRLRMGGSWNSGTEKSMTMLKKLAETSLNSNHSILVLWGESDTVVPIDQAKLLVSISPQARLCVLGEADHMGFADGPSHVRLFFIERILAFLKQDPDRMMVGIREYFEREPYINGENGYLHL